jgi:catechol 2,3-dioxygenase-like lactoylglutathione lyase family enzyme
VAPHLKLSVPFLRVRDVRAAEAFYCGVLGFVRNWEHQFDTGAPRVVSISRGGLTLFLTEDPECSSGALVYCYLDGIDEFVHEIIASGGVPDWGPRDQPWGMRECQVSDPDGNQLRFGQRAGIV